MSLLRQVVRKRLCRSQLGTQEVSYSAVSDFVKNVRSAVERSPEVKKTVDSLKKNAEDISERAKSAMEDFANSAKAQSASSSASKATTQSAKSTEGSSKPEARTEQPGAESSGAHTSESYDQTRNSQQAGPEASSSGSSSKKEQSRQPFSARLQNAFQTIRKEVSTASHSADRSDRRISTGVRQPSNIKTSSAWPALKIEDAVLPRQEVVSATKARNPNIRPSGDPGSSAVSVVKQQESRWQKQWTEMQDKFGTHPLFQRLRGLSDNKVFNKGREVADDLRERWETSDSPLVQRIQDMKDSMSTETEQAQALREIRSRYPDFDMVQFVRVLKGDVPLVIKAYLEGNLEALKEHCSPEMMERFSGIIAAQKAEGLITDSTILDVSDVELVDLKFVERNPVVVVQFTCQQINCARDRFGNVVEGGPQDVQRVYYYWALQQDDAGFVGEDGKFHPPRWQLREMMVRGMHNLL